MTFRHAIAFVSLPVRYPGILQLSNHVIYRAQVHHSSSAGHFRDTFESPPVLETDTLELVNVLRLATESIIQFKLDRYSELTT